MDMRPVNPLAHPSPELDSPFLLLRSSFLCPTVWHSSSLLGCRVAGTSTRTPATWTNLTVCPRRGLTPARTPALSPWIPLSPLGAMEALPDPMSSRRSMVACLERLIEGARHAAQDAGHAWLFC